MQCFQWARTDNGAQTAAQNEVAELNDVQAELLQTLQSAKAEVAEMRETVAAHAVLTEAHEKLKVEMVNTEAVLNEIKVWQRRGTSARMG